MRVNCHLVIISAFSVGLNAQVLDFELTPTGSEPTDNQVLSLDAAYSIDGIEVRFGFDENGDGTVESNALFERAGEDGTDGFQGPYGNDSTWTDALAEQLGTWFLRSDTVGQDPGVFVIRYSVPVTALGGEIWDIDGSPNNTEKWQVRLYDTSGALLRILDSPEGSSGGAGSLNGRPWVFSFIEPAGVASICIEFTGTKTSGIGLAFNNFAATSSIPGPTLLCRSPDAYTGVERGAGGVPAVTLAWSEAVIMTETDLTVLDGGGNSIAATVSGSQTQLTTITFATPIIGTSYTIRVHDSVVASRNYAPIDGDGDGAAGGDAILSLTHACDGDFNADHAINTIDVLQFLSAWAAGCR